MNDEFQNGTQGEIITKTVVSDKSKLVAALLCFFLGGLGIHRFYLGYTGSGILLIIISVLGLFTSAFLIGFGLWAIEVIWIIIDLIRIIVGGLKDSQGRALR